MSTQVQRRKGTTAQHASFTGASAELTVDTTKNTVVVHDGATAGGIPLAKETGSAISATSLSGPLTGTVGATTANTGAFTTVTNSGGERFTAAGSEYARIQLNSSTGALELMAGSTTAAGISLASNVATFLNNPVLTGGAANGVPYLNGSKVLTTGTALKWDLTTLTATGSGSAGEVAIRTGDTASNTSYLTFGTTNYNRAQIAVSGSALTEGYMAFLTSTGGSGAEQMRLTSTGMGIGTSSPSAKLEVNGVTKLLSGGAGGLFGSDNSGYFLFQASTTANAAAIYLNGQARSGFASYIQYAGAQHIWLNETVGIERMRIDGSGNLGLGVTPSASSACTNIELPYGATLSARSNTAAPQFAMSSNAVGNWYAPTYKIDGYATQYTQQGFEGTHKWYTAPSGTAGNAITFTQAMTLDASGNLLVGTTSASTAAVAAGFQVQTNSGAGATINIGHPNGASSGFSYALFSYDNTIIGSIGQAGTTGVLYNVTSDYRLKTVIGAVADSGARIDALQPVEYEWKADGSRTRGFLAHQFQEVYAGSVSGTKDAVDADGNPVYQAMQASSSEVIADLIAEIQSLRKRLAALEVK